MNDTPLLSRPARCLLLSRPAVLALLSLPVLLVAAACDPEPGPPDAEVIDANYNPVDAARDAGPGDRGPTDRAPLDHGAADAGADAGGDATLGDADRLDRGAQDASGALDDAAGDAAGAEAGTLDNGSGDSSPGEAGVADAADLDALGLDAQGLDAQGLDALGLDGGPGDRASLDAGPSDRIGSDGAPWASCDPISFTYRGSGVGEVLVAGTFNGWAPTAVAGAWPMSDPEEDGSWSVTAAVEPGVHQYKLVVDGDWILDPENPDTVDDGEGNTNSRIVVRGCAMACPDTFDWRDAVLYFALVDRFRDADGLADPVAGASDGDAANGPSGQYEGGDLAGVTEKLDYLTDLGVTALWLSAPYDNRDVAGGSIDPASDSHAYSSYHGYWPSPAAIDYSDPAAPVPEPLVESRIGDATALHELVAAAHGAPSASGRGVRVIFDYVMNHADIESGLYAEHPGWFVDPVRLCQPEDLWGDPYWGTRCSFNDYIPSLDLHEPDPLAWSVRDAVWWATAFGIDGYRLDAIKHVPMEWLTTLRAELTAAIPTPVGDRFFLVGETFDYSDRDLLRSFVDPATKLDGQFDFPFKRELCHAVFTPDGSLDALSWWLGQNDGYYGPGAIMTTWIGNHDVPRAIHFASRQIGSCTEGSHAGNSWTDDYPQPTDPEPYERLAVAFAVMMTNPGVPLIYYGDEVGLAGGGDPDNRRLMPWEDRGATLSVHQLALREAVSSLANARARRPALSRGFREWLSSSQDTWVYRMSGCGEAAEVTVAINRADDDRTVALPAGRYLDLMTEGEVTGGERALPPRSFLVLEGR